VCLQQLVLTTMKTTGCPTRADQVAALQQLVLELLLQR
jgi:hypothetical protein